MSLDKKGENNMKNSTYSFVKLEEVVDNMSQALTGLAKSLNKTRKVVDILSSAKRSTEVKEEIEEMKKALDAKEKEYNALLAHRNMLNVLLDKYKAADDATKAIMEDELLTVFVAFNVIRDDELDEE